MSPSLKTAELLAFVALGLAALVHWRRRPTSASAWMAATFCSLGAAVALGTVAGEEPGPERAWLVRGAILGLALFPYALYRFAETFRLTRRLSAIAAVVALGALVAATLVLPDITDPEKQTTVKAVYSVAFVGFWTVLSSSAVMLLYRAGRTWAVIVRRRMRTLALGAVAVNVALFVVAASGSDPSTASRVTSRLVGLAGAVLFAAGFVPPAFLRAIWRREEMERLRAVHTEIVRAETRADLCSVVLPNAAALVGGHGAFLHEPGAGVVATYGLSRTVAEALAAGGEADGSQRVLTVECGHGIVGVTVPATAPDPGADEIALLRSMIDFAELAAERTALLDRTRATTEELRERESQLADAQRTARLGSYRWDLHGGGAVWSEEMYRVLGIDPASGELGSALLDRVHPDDVEAVAQMWADLATATVATKASIDYRIVLPDGAERWIQGRAVPEVGPDGRVTGFTGTVQDITERKLAEEQLAYRATHDALTDLPNRRLLVDRLTHALERRERHPAGLAVLFIDIDRFKWVNDSLGHPAGDALLLAVASRLRAALRSGDTVARFGGDEFVVLCEDVATEDMARRLALRFAAEIEAPVILLGEETLVTVSVGIAFVPPEGPAELPEVFLRDADAALYEAKARGRDRIEIFSPETRRQVVARHGTANALRRGMERDEIEVWFQPEVDLATHHVVGVEALARWLHPERGLISPADFIPVAEESGLIVRLGERILRQSCRHLAQWGRDDPRTRDLVVSVNLAARQVLTPGLTDTVANALAEYDVPPSRLCLEITESVLLEDAETSARVLGELKDLGVRIGVDDFGTGFSSLTYLKRFPVDELKIDRTFVAGLEDNAHDMAIVAGIVDLAHAFGLTSVAEGVETSGQLAELTRLGCEQAQGYLWTPAVAPPLLAQWMQDWLPSLHRLDDAQPTAFRMLIVDDDPSVRRVLRAVLEGEDGFDRVAEADDGRNAIALARLINPDVVLLDLAMPGMGGLEALPLIAAVAPNAKVIVVSGMDNAEMEEMAARRGAAGFFPKGRDPMELLGLLDRVRAG